MAFTNLRGVRLVAVTGQSNARNQNMDWFRSYNYGFAMGDGLAIVGASILGWQPGASVYNRLVTLVNEQKARAPGAPIWFWFIQGETEATSPALAAQYLGWMTAFADGIEAQTGVSLYWLDTLLASDMTAAGYTEGPAVNAAKMAFTRSSGRLYRLNPDDYAGGMNADNLHWNPTRQAAMRAAMNTLITSVA